MNVTDLYIFMVLAALQTLYFALSCFTHSINFGMFFIQLLSDICCQICVPNFSGVLYGLELFKEYSTSTGIKEPLEFSFDFCACVALLIWFACTLVSAFSFSLKIFTEKKIYKKSNLPIKDSTCALSAVHAWF